MPTILQLRRGSTAENDAYTGSVGELTVDTTLNTVRVHDGSTAGGTVVGKSTGNIQVAVTGDNEIDTSSGNLTIDSAGGTVTVDDNLTVSGNLTVNGTTTTVNSTNTTLDDNLLELNSGASSNANDSGIIIERGSTGDNAIIAWDESADKFIVGTTTATASDTGNLTISTGTLVANIEATTATLGGSNVVSTDNSLELTNKTISGSSNTISNIANSSLTNSSITINGCSVSLGGSTTITAGCDYTPTCSTSNIVISETQNTTMTGTNNTVVGNNAGQCINSGGQSTFIGGDAGCSVTNGGLNVAVGWNSAKSLVYGANNTAIGSSAMSQAGAGAGCNTVVGASAGYFKESCNVTIGTYAARGSGSMGVYAGITGTNNIVIGYDAQPSSGNVSNEITIGNATHTLLRIPGLGSTDGQVLTYSSYYGGIVLEPIPAAAVKICNSANIVTSGIGGDGGQGSRNIIIGSNSGYSVTTGSDNIMLGFNSGYSTTSGSYNVFLGGSTGRCNTTGKHNVFIGDKSGCRNTIGTYNVFIGKSAGQCNTTGVANIALGENAGRYNLVGLNNISIGKNASCKTTGSGVVSLGAYAGWCGTNAACSVNIGYFAGRSVSGACNVAIGFAAMMQNASQANVGIGARAGQSLEDGAACNVMLGAQAGCQALNGTNNIAIGFDAQLSSTTASNEITIGNVTHNLLRIPGLGSTDGQVLTYSSACGGIVLAAASGGGGGCDWSVNSSNTNITVQDSPNTNIGGYQNTLVGFSAGACTTTAGGNTFIGAGAGYFNSTGGYNTVLGRNAGYEITTGCCNVVLGTFAAAGCGQCILSTGSNNILIGHYAAPSSSAASNEITIGNVTHSLLRIPGLGSTDGQVLTYSSYYGGIVLEPIPTAAVNRCGAANIVTSGIGGDGGQGSRNIIIGSNSGYSVTTGSDNIMLGFNSGYNITSGSNNIFLGRNVGDNISTGQRNVIIGAYAACAVTNNDTQFQTIVGFRAGQKVSSQSSTMIGAYAGQNITGRYNVFMGINVGRNMTTGGCNVAIGASALISGTSSTHMTAIGHDVAKNGWFCNSVAIGSNQMIGTATVSTQYTIAIGSINMTCLTTGKYNIAIGGRNMCSFGSGTSNIAIGTTTLAAATYGTNNVMVGDEAAQASHTEIHNNIGIGKSALKVVAANCNIGIGSFAGCSLVTGTNNVLIGYNAQASSTTANNEITIGNVTHNLLRIPGLGSTDGQVLTYSSACGGIVLAAASGGGGGGAINICNSNNVVSCIGGDGGSGTHNVLIGQYTGSLCTLTASAQSNIAIGRSALKTIHTGNQNIAIGDYNMASLTSGKYNIALGAFAGGCSTVGCYNIGIGNSTLSYVGNNVTSIGNIGIGSQSGKWTSTSKYNIAIGHKSAYGAYASFTGVAGNIAMGYNSGNSKSWNNITIGQCAGYANNSGMSGSSNIGIGTSVFSASGMTISAYSNTAIGSYAMNKINTGGKNTAVGANSMECITSGEGNVAVGNYSLHDNEGGCDNIAVGRFAMSSFMTPFNLQKNVAIGGQAACTFNDAQCHVVLGYGAGRTTTTATNNIIIGAYASASTDTASNEITLGNTSHTCIRANVTTISSLSDQRDKTNVCDLNVGLCFVNDLRPVTFDWDRRDGTMAGHKDVGFIAQDLDALQQKYDIEENLKIVLKENPERLEATPGKLIPILVKAIQELSAEVKKLKENK